MSTPTKHTPWTFERQFLIIRDAKGASVCQVSSRPTAESNAYLIAAAPALYEALEKVIPQLEAQYESLDAAANRAIGTQFEDAAFRQADNAEAVLNEARAALKLEKGEK